MVIQLLTKYSACYGTWNSFFILFYLALHLNAGYFLSILDHIPPRYYRSTFSSDFTTLIDYKYSFIHPYEFRIKGKVCVVVCLCVCLFVCVYALMNSYFCGATSQIGSRFQYCRQLRHTADNITLLQRSDQLVAEAATQHKANTMEKHICSQ
jgi:hypothetical protein